MRKLKQYEGFLYFVLYFIIAGLLSGCSSEDMHLQLGKKLTIGIVLIGDESDEGYSYNHMAGLRKACNELIISEDNIIVKRGVPDNEESERAMRELADAGCDVIFATSFNFEESMLKVAADYPDIEFFHCSGFRVADSGLRNAHNYFPKIFEARYLSGIAAGMKAAELGNPFLGYVGAYDTPEVISGFSSFYLGAKSVNPKVTMRVIYTMDWDDTVLEEIASRRLIEGGAGVLGQHANSNVPALIAEELGIFQVGYNSDMVSYAPKASLISARMRWSVFYKYALLAVRNGEEITGDWNGGWTQDAVFLSPLNAVIAAPGTQDAIDEAAKRIGEGYHVFSGPLYGVSASGNKLHLKEGEFFDESGEKSCPTFDYIIPGITVEYLEE